MATEVKTGAEDVRWDLTELYSSTTDPAIEATLKAGMEDAQAFEADYKGRLAHLDDAALAQAFARYEAILTRAQPPGTYAHLVHAADTANPRHGALMVRIQERATQVQKPFRLVLTHDTDSSMGKGVPSLRTA